jgi:hypothetical protein
LEDLAGADMKKRGRWEEWSGVTKKCSFSSLSSFSALSAETPAPVPTPLLSTPLIPSRHPARSKKREREKIEWRS